VHGARGWKRGGREDEAVAQRDGAVRPPRARAGGGRPGGALWRQQVTKNGAGNAKRRARYPSATRGLGALLQRPRAPGSLTDAKAASASRLACCMMQLATTENASFFVSIVVITARGACRRRWPRLIGGKKQVRISYVQPLLSCVRHR
jgi:hypothetical protein